MKDYDIFEIHKHDPQAPWNQIDVPEDFMCPLCRDEVEHNCNCECPHPDCDESARYCDQHEESADTYAAMQAYQRWEAMNEPGER